MKKEKKETVKKEKAVSGPSFLYISLTLQPPKPRVKKEPTEKKTKVKKEKEVKEENGVKKEGENVDEEEDGYKWWLEQDKDDGVKWTTLEHAGPYFPPPYEPHGIKMKYNGVQIELEPEAEEVASFFAALVGTDWAANPVFCKNFFADFLAVLKKCKKVFALTRYRVLMSVDLPHQGIRQVRLWSDHRLLEPTEGDQEEYDQGRKGRSEETKASYRR